MAKLDLHPRLAGWRVVTFQGHVDPDDWPDTADPVSLEVDRKIEVSLAIPETDDAPPIALVDVWLVGSTAGDEERLIVCEARYQFQFAYPEPTRAGNVASNFEDDTVQYSLVSQAHPVAWCHFQQAIVPFGMRAPDLPMGV